MSTHPFSLKKNKFPMHLGYMKNGTKEKKIQPSTDRGVQWSYQ